MKQSRSWSNLVVSGSGQVTARDIAQERARLWDHWMEHPWNWITGVDTTNRTPEFPQGRPIIWTKDERDEEAPLKSFPKQLDYLREYVEVLHREKAIMVDKPRQMLVTITTCLYIDWHCRRFENRLWLVSKIKEEAAAKIINDKIRAVHMQLPLWVRADSPMSSKPWKTIRYPVTRSEIMAVAQNAAVGDSRGNTASGIFIDEGAFQDMFRAIWIASLPMAEKLITVSTANIGSPGARAYKFFLDEGREG